MSVWTPIKYALNASLGTGGFEPLDTTIGKRADAAGNSASASLFGWIKRISAVLDTVNANAGRGAVKSIQKGSLSVTTSMSGAVAYQVTVSSVNAAKSLAFITSRGQYSASVFAAANLYNSTRLDITAFATPANAYATVVSWLLLELY
jgi:hypothetical protein